MDRLVYFKAIAANPATLDAVCRPISGAHAFASDDARFDAVDRQSRRRVLAQDR
ncbi:hypothetical protein [Rhizobium ruizarguesonis]|jgi:hypothetical protein|uniref:hypothetical protein n=1 Tax=Rhizobium ruizarguesonis TaxID=2081791 RepID=UPI001FE159E8|nr:hypothetical protein [Rhizobium ruizarguesonis]